MKKNQMAAILLILLLVCAALVACSHTHNYEWRYDDDIHWKECSCGEKTSRERHLFSSEYTYDDNYHWNECVCGNIGNKESHNYNIEKFDETYHWKECVCGAQTEKAKHVYSLKYQSDDMDHWNECECGHRINEEAHNFKDKIERAATCNEKGLLKRTCSDCGKTIEEFIGEIPHQFGEDNKCKQCGTDRPYYSYSEDGKYLYFGEYPQTNVTDEILIQQLNTMYGNLPANKTSGNWISYEYDSQNGSDFMWYIDIELSGNKYRGVYFTDYRSYYVGTPSSIENSCQFDNGYMINEVYWFEFEPIKWRILSQNGETALIMSDIILDSQAFQSNYQSLPYGIHANNYEYSTIRMWLNDNFYNGAFDDYERLNIRLTEVDNSIATTGLDNPGYVCNDTEDHVFLLSYNDCVNTDYGFSHINNELAARRLQPSPYSMSQGAYVSTIEYIGNGWWWTRSPRNTSDLLCGIYSAGRTDSDYRYNLTACGVVPALTIEL